MPSLIRRIKRKLGMGDPVLGVFAEKITPSLGGATPLPRGFSPAVESMVAALQKKRLHRGRLAVVTGPQGAALAVAGATALRMDRRLWIVKPEGLTGRYLGETEKNLDALLSRAEADEAALLFDDADAMFDESQADQPENGQRAYLSTGYLLDRLERASLLSIFGTREVPDVDEGLRRRFAAFVQVG